MQTTEARPISQILATSESFAARPTTPPPSQDCSESAKQKRRVWLDKWLGLKITHCQLSAAEIEIHTLCKDFAKRPDRGRTLVIFGENGSGKTHIAKALKYWANRNAMRFPLVIREDLEDQAGLAWTLFANWPQVVDGFQKRQEFNAVEPMFQCSMLILDDIGAEHDPSKYGVGQLYLLLNRREFKWNIITTNKPPASWEEAFDRRVASRLQRNAQHIDLSQVPDFSTT